MDRSRTGVMAALAAVLLASVTGGTASAGQLPTKLTVESHTSLSVHHTANPGDWPRYVGTIELAKAVPFPKGRSVPVALAKLAFKKCLDVFVHDASPGPSAVEVYNDARTIRLSYQEPNSFTIKPTGKWQSIGLPAGPLNSHTPIRATGGWWDINHNSVLGSPPQHVKYNGQGINVDCDPFTGHGIYN
jgi:hypothetical protein